MIGASFLCCPIIYICSGFAKQPLQLDRGPLDGSVPSVCRPYRVIKKQIQMHSRCSAPILFFVFDFASRRRTLASRRICLAGVARRVCVATRSAESGTGHPRVGLACLAEDVMHVFTAQLAFSLCRSRWLRPSRPLATWSPLQ